MKPEKAQKFSRSLLAIALVAAVAPAWAEQLPDISKVPSVDAVEATLTWDLTCTEGGTCVKHDQGDPTQETLIIGDYVNADSTSDTDAHKISNSLVIGDASELKKKSGMQMLVNDLTGVTGVIYASNASKVDQQMVRGLGGDHNRLVIIADNKDNPAKMVGKEQ